VQVDVTFFALFQLLFDLMNDGGSGPSPHTPRRAFQESKASALTKMPPPRPFSLAFSCNIRPGGGVNERHGARPEIRAWRRIRRYSRRDRGRSSRPRILSSGVYSRPDRIETVLWPESIHQNRRATLMTASLSTLRRQPDVGRGPLPAKGLSFRTPRPGRASSSPPTRRSFASHAAVNNAHYLVLVLSTTSRKESDSELTT